ncbi:hypothetical protein DL769_005467 [Monosporascus sp. CRB-8-3]|nr:hypothetical protein DL769_005467 [Monosporascus sp. CRB-8-3]
MSEKTNNEKLEFKGKTDTKVCEQLYGCFFYHCQPDRDPGVSMDEPPGKITDRARVNDLMTRALFDHADTIRGLDASDGMADLRPRHRSPIRHCP